jgi:hypothetical protein
MRLWLANIAGPGKRGLGFSLLFRNLFLIGLFMPLSGGFSIFLLATPLMADSLYICLELKEERFPDGRAGVRIELRPSRQAAIDQIEVYYRLSDHSFRPDKPPGPPKFYRRKLSPGAGGFRLATDRFKKADFWVKSIVEGRAHFAQTQALMLGNSHYSDLIDHELLPSVAHISQAEDWPEIRAAWPGGIWPRLGKKMTVTLEEARAEALQPDSGSPAEIRIYDHKGPLSTLYPENGSCSYVLPLDEELDRKGHSATKPIYIVRPLGQGGASCLTLYVFRSDTEGLSLQGGLPLLALGLGLGLAWTASGKTA